MATNQRLRPWQYRLLAIMIGLTLVVGGAITAATMPATGQTNVEMGEFRVGDVNETVDGDVSDVTLAADLAYQHDVPDATRRLVKLKVGPDEDNLETVAFVQDDDPSGQDSGTVTLSGSLTDTSAFDAADFDPALAESQTREVVVAATIEVRRANGDPVTTTVTDTVTVTLHDGATLSATVGGSGSINVATN